MDFIRACQSFFQKLFTPGPTRIVVSRWWPRALWPHLRCGELSVVACASPLLLSQPQAPCLPTQLLWNFRLEDLSDIDLESNLVAVVLQHFPEVITRRSGSSFVS